MKKQTIIAVEKFITLRLSEDQFDGILGCLREAKEPYAQDLARVLKHDYDRYVQMDAGVLP